MSVTPEDVRHFLRDYVEENHLNDEEDFSNERIKKAVDFTVADFNETPVFTSFPPFNFPFVDLLLHGTAAWLLEGLSVSQTRNHLSYSTGGVSIDDSNKGPEYSALSMRFRQMYEDKKRQIKNQINLEQGWGQVASEYFTNRAW